MELFHFYLDAWKFCKDNHIKFEKIRRNDWTTWIVEFDVAEKV